MALGTAGAQIFFDLLADWRAGMGLTANLPGTTVRRVRGALQMNSADTSPGATTGTLIGIRKVGVGETVQFDQYPSTAPHLDWMTFDFAPASMPWAGGGITTGTLYGYAIDTKSQRRLDEPQETLGLFLEQTADADTATFYGWVSVLLALP